MRFHRGDGDALVDVAATHDEVRRGFEIERFVRCVAHRDVAVATAREQQRRAISQRGFRFGDRGQGFDLGEHRLGSIEGLLHCLREHDGVCLTDEADPLHRERRPEEVVVDLDEPVVSGQPSSAAVHTSTTPGMARASPTSIEVMTPWATSERTKTAESGRSSCRSAMNRRAPVSNSGSSVRMTRFPKIEPPDAGASERCVVVMTVYTYLCL